MSRRRAAAGTGQGALPGLSLAECLGRPDVLGRPPGCAHPCGLLDYLPGTLGRVVVCGGCGEVLDVPALPLLRR